ncbi:dihydrofolate reductase family protein [Microbacterium gorillae]|uniref:dihydrofolate reductase family protein n=1 Tax=Microbacterium gorillae TaxID=1231063 RepID=UPI003D975476
MRTLRYYINVTVDGCVDHREGDPTEDVNRAATASIARADELLFGRIVYQMMEEAWRNPLPADSPAWEIDFADTISRARKTVVSRTLESVDWNATLLRGDLAAAVTAMKSQPGGEILVSGVTLPTALAELDLIDEYEFLVQPHVAGHGPYLLAGLTTRRRLEPVYREEFSSGAVLTRYRRVG